jgi:phenylacetic acid degradation protein
MAALQPSAARFSTGKYCKERCRTRTCFASQLLKLGARADHGNIGLHKAINTVESLVAFRTRKDSILLQVYSIDGLTPVVHPTAYVHPSAILIGDVIVGPGCYIGPLASLRGDFGRIVIEEGANIQDTCVLHGFYETDTVVGQDGHIGHGAILHGCIIGKDALVGMNAVVMDNAVIGESCIVAATAFIKAGFVAPMRTLVVGSPAKVMRELRDDEIAWKQTGTRTYHDLARRSMTSLQQVSPLSAPEPLRPRIPRHTESRPKGV